MNNKQGKLNVLAAVLLGAACQTLHAETVNTWRGTAVSADWNDRYQWNLNHPPKEGEAAHFRQNNCVISVNGLVELDSGIYLYGQELMMKGNGNIILRSQIPLERTVNIPASADGFANLTLCDNLTLTGRISLSAKGFGTSACKGTITLKDRSTVTGGLAIGNNGVGTGLVIVEDNASFRITDIELNTLASKGGMAEIRILGGTVRIEADTNLFDMLMADPSRKIVIGESGTLRIDSKLPIARKKEMLKALIASNRLIATPGCQLTPPVLQNEMVIARAENAQLRANGGNQNALLSQIDQISESTPANNNSNLGDLVKALQAEVNQQDGMAHNSSGSSNNANSPRMAGYIVIFGSLLLALRRPKAEE